MMFLHVFHFELCIFKPFLTGYFHACNDNEHSPWPISQNRPSSHGEVGISLFWRQISVLTMVGPWPYIWPITGVWHRLHGAVFVFTITMHWACGLS